MVQPAPSGFPGLTETTETGPQWAQGPRWRKRPGPLGACGQGGVPRSLEEQQPTGPRLEGPASWPNVSDMPGTR